MSGFGLFFPAAGYLKKTDLKGFRSRAKSPLCVCLLLVSALEKVPFLFALDCAQGRQNLFSEPGQQPKSLWRVGVNWAQTNLTALLTLSPQRPRSRAWGLQTALPAGSQRAQPCSPRGPLLPRKTKPRSFPWKITWLKGRELKRSPQKGDLGLVLRS